MRLTISFLALTIMALGVLTACNSAEWRSVQTSPAPRAGAPAPPVMGDGVRRVTVAELKNLIAKNEAFVIDVRNQNSFDVAHIRGARLIPEAEVINHAAELPRNKLIVTYCS